MSHHIVLLGDSSFDNGAYIGGEPDVCAHLRAIVPEPWSASSLALDGSTIANLSAQLRQAPAAASHLVVSIGGNDALTHWGALRMPVATITDALMEWTSRVNGFEEAYRAAVADVVAAGLSTVVCTIYNGRLDSPRAEAARLALRLFNDAILRVAFSCRLPVIDLRLVCVEPSDYATPIEPSGSGGLKIARVIAEATGALKTVAEGTRVFGG